jgi:hypothetical protein
MKKIALALLCVFATGSATAQTYACQFIMSAGMGKEQSGWKVAEFPPYPSIFFLKMGNGVIDTNSLTESPLSMPASHTSCTKTANSQSEAVKGDDNFHWCAYYAGYLSFYEKTLNGGFARTYGAMQSTNDNQVDRVLVQRFKCQKAP